MSYELRAMTIRLKDSHLDAIKRQAEAAYPYECCGLLLGMELGDTKAVEELLPLENAREDSPHNRFLIPPGRVKEGNRMARERGMEVLGFYHSHPDAGARPSAYDLEHAWPWYSYIILSVKGGEAAGLTSWRMAGDRSGFVPEEIVLW